MSIRIEDIFFELLLVAIGNADCLSHTPTDKEWKALYDMAKKQSLVGVCFAGVQKLVEQQRAPEEMLYLTWMGMAAKIQQRNEVVNRQCVVLQASLAGDGFRSCILKGQGVARFYGSIAGLRQSGDIDIWVEGRRDNTIKNLREKGINIKEADIHHGVAECFRETEVEIHFKPSWFYNPFTYRTFNNWIDSKSNDCFCNEKGGIITPTTEFNLVYLVIHIYRHFLSEGVGIRQLMDYYFVLLASNEIERANANYVLRKLGLERFSSAIMACLEIIFSLEKCFCFIESNFENSTFVLQEILNAGNFGKSDKRYKWDGNLVRCMHPLFKRWLLMVRYYPSEIVCQPFWKLWHYSWRKMHHYI